MKLFWNRMNRVLTILYVIDVVPSWNVSYCKHYVKHNRFSQKHQWKSIFSCPISHFKAIFIHFLIINWITMKSKSLELWNKTENSCEVLCCIKQYYSIILIDLNFFSWFSKSCFFSTTNYFDAGMNWIDIIHKFCNLSLP